MNHAGRGAGWRFENNSQLLVSHVGVGAELASLAMSSCSISGGSNCRSMRVSISSPNCGRNVLGKHE